MTALLICYGIVAVCQVLVLVGHFVLIAPASRDVSASLKRLPGTKRPRWAGQDSDLSSRSNLQLNEQQRSKAPETGPICRYVSCRGPEVANSNGYKPQQAIEAVRIACRRVVKEGIPGR